MNPRFLIGDEWLELVSLWVKCRGSDTAPGPLPESGGAGEQCEWLLAAFSCLEQLWQMQRREDED